jgi:hypothetical protein
MNKYFLVFFAVLAVQNPCLSFNDVIVCIQGLI